MSITRREGADKIAKAVSALERDLKALRVKHTAELNGMVSKAEELRIAHLREQLGKK